MPALNDLVAGKVQLQFSGLGAAMEYVKPGKVRALAVTTATRTEALPNIPTVGEFLPGYEATTWLGIGAPKNTPAEIVEKLNNAINAGLADSKMKARLADLGMVPMPMTSAESGNSSPTKPRMGQSGEVGGGQTAVNQATGWIFHITRSANGRDDRYGTKRTCPPCRSMSVYWG